MTIQEQIDLRVAEIEAALAAKIGPSARVRYDVERDGDATKAWVFTFSLTRGKCVALSMRHKTIDEALTEALATVLALRTYEDECADLGIAPIPTKVGEAE